MPGCCAKDKANEKERVPEKKPDEHWREPPGYLGEAVRRAKRIPSRHDKVPEAAAET